MVALMNLLPFSNCHIRVPILWINADNSPSGNWRFWNQGEKSSCRGSNKAWGLSSHSWQQQTHYIGVNVLHLPHHSFHVRFLGRSFLVQGWRQKWKESIIGMDAELPCLDLLIFIPLHASYNQFLHGILFYRRSTALGRYCVKRLTSRCTVVIIEHGEIILNKKGELVEEDTTSMISLQYLHVHLFYSSTVGMMCIYFMLVQFLQQGCSRAKKLFCWSLVNLKSVTLN